MPGRVSILAFREHWLCGNYLEQSEERSTELAQDMIDLSVEGIGLEQRSPSLENGVCDLQHTNVDGRVGRRQLGNKILNKRNC